MYNPVSTIRLQFNKDFTFAKFEELIPFFIDLGIRTIYASPIFKSASGSTHGYDVIDPLTINPEIGTEEDLIRISKKLRENGVGWIQDIVPNHMAFDSSNPWLYDVLEKGPASPYSMFFDTALSGDFFRNKIMVPFLGEPLTEAIHSGKLKLNDDHLEYFDHRFPVNERSRGISDVETVHDMQFYRLCHFKETDTNINYRRFFTINGLICLKIDDQQVFDHYHALIARLVRDGVFDGLRVDHIDGLYDPVNYLRRLRGLAGPETYIIVEKILEPEEKLDPWWPIEGTTGYEFLGAVNNLFTWSGARRSFDKLYRSIAPENSSFGRNIFDSKRLILTKYMSGELDNLTRYFIDLGLGSEKYLIDDLRNAIAELLVRCPQYRFYGTKMPLGKEERTAFEELIDECRVNCPQLAASFDQLDEALIDNVRRSKDHQQRAAKFYMRLMQFTGPLMAKGVEDTLMYQFNRFVGHNEVGDLPDEFGLSTDTFHTTMVDRLERWQLSLNATATHDTKRGEDARMRLNVLTDISDQWVQSVTHWFEINKQYKDTSIDPNDEYFIYQTLIATYPDQEASDYIERIDRYLVKALREGKVHSRWDDPDESYEQGVLRFVHNILRSGSEFMTSFLPFFQKVDQHGKINSLSQLLLKVACPGVPDIYQGSLLWDLSFVDPDNRRPVDYDLVGNSLRDDSHPKLFLIKKLLAIRKDNVKIFTYGNYKPLKVTGTLARHVVAFGREYQGTWIIAAALLHTARLKSGSVDWTGTQIQLPEEWVVPVENLLNKISVRKDDQSIDLSQLFQSLPVALLKFKVPKTKRSAGILMPVASLPSSYSIGDIGMAGRAFADFLFKSRQKIWQMLPVNEIDKHAAFSPYSAVSSIAGSTLLISIDDLVLDGLLDVDDVKKSKAKQTIDYEAASKEKAVLLDKAWRNFNARRPVALIDDLNEFEHQEKTWLDGYATFIALQRSNDNKPWTEWPEEFRDRTGSAIDKFKEEHADEIRKIRWLQFIFFRQMKSLRRYCNERGIKLMGDVPFYVSAPSADVWLYRDVFDVNASGRVNGISGVPPDYFNDEGQLWGMPVFNWESNKNGVYAWWTERLRKNLLMYDLVRLDHFRAFVDYWRVEGGSKNAVKGEWLKGPGLDFFEAMKRDLGELSFVAEDLGDVGPDVYELRDKLSLPGMTVLQYGFGGEFPTSIHLPHNYSERSVAYPGTHDNNTTRGWYNQETGSIEKEHLSKYFDARVNARNVATLFMRAVYSSHAGIAMVAMQDVLGLDERSRINTPSTGEGNWLWRMKDMPDEDVITKLRRMMFLYER